MNGKAVIFDMFGVLCCPTSPELEIIREYELDLGVHDSLQRAVCGYKFNGDWKEYIDGIMEAANIKNTAQNKGMVVDICTYEFQKGLNTPNPSARDVLGSLRSDGYELGLVSNAYPPSMEILEKNGLIEYFEEGAVILSYKVGMTKQNPEIFKMCLERLDIPAHSAVMVGDSLKSDILASRHATNGEMGGILISANPSDEAIDSGCIIVPSLSDVPEAIKNHFKQRN